MSLIFNHCTILLNNHIRLEFRWAKLLTTKSVLNMRARLLEQQKLASHIPREFLTILAWPLSQMIRWNSQYVRFEQEMMNFKMFDLWSGFDTEKSKIVHKMNRGVGKLCVISGKTRCERPESKPGRFWDHSSRILLDSGFYILILIQNASENRLRMVVGRERTSFIS